MLRENALVPCCAVIPEKGLGIMNISEEALTLMRQAVKDTLAENLKLAGLAAVLTGNDVPTQGHTELLSEGVLTLMRQFQKEVAAYNLKLANLAAVLTGDGPPNSHTTPGHSVQVDGGRNTIKPPVASGPHDF
jgi:hypothetical protein